jgi:hypothetical protein
MKTLLLFLAPMALLATDWTPLFNGQDLAGWVNVNCAPETWSVRDNMIICTGKPTGVLRTERHYENFIMEVEWRHMRQSGNAGVFVWGEGISAPGVPFARGIEVQVLENAYGGPNKPNWFTTHGDVFPIHGSKMTPDNPRGGSRSFPLEERSLPSPQWNRYVIVCVDGMVKLSVNGRFVTGGRDCDYRKGYICLESEGSEVHFRNLRVLELPGGLATPEQTAPVAEPIQVIYNGVDLRGWQVGDRQAKSWKSQDWQLQFKPDGEPGNHLPAEKRYQNYSFLCDYKPSSAGKCPVRLGDAEHWGLGKLPDGTTEAIAKVEKVNKYNRLRIDHREGKVTLTLNKSVIFEGVPSGRSAPDSVALADHREARSLASIYIIQH